MLRPAGSRSTQQSDGQHSGAVKVSAVLVHVTQEQVDQPVSTSPTGKDTDTTSPTGKDTDTDCASQLDRQAE